MTQTSCRMTELPGLVARGKVRDIYDLGPRLMIVATDRISAFDVVMDEPVPDKGVLLTKMSRFWLDTLPACAPHHLDYVVSAARVPPGYEPHREQLAGRTMVVRKAAVLPVECVVRGYIVGGGWKEYTQAGSVSGVRLPPGLKLAQKLPEPIFTPSTKATDGHDEPLSFEQAIEHMLGAIPRWATFLNVVEREANRSYVQRLLEQARDRSLAIYAQAARLAETRGIIIADTKLEFGLCEGELLLVDEVLTPDSSRFWPADQYRVGANPPSFDKQFLRDYLESIGWEKRPPPPPIPSEIIEQTRQRYAQACTLLTA